VHGDPSKVVGCNQPLLGNRGLVDEIGASGQKSDAEVIEESLRDPPRFTAVFERHFPAIHRYLARRVGSGPADDLAADVFVVAFERRGSFQRGATDARPWLYGIATNVLRRHNRSEQRRLGAVALLRAGDNMTALDTQIDDLGERARVARALSLLDAEQRDALLLHVWGGLTHAEVSTSLGIPQGTAASRIARARARLRDLLGGNEAREEDLTVLRWERDDG
jgi:RNA polymerase sigma-70 factor, ECF subfamily